MTAVSYDVERRDVLASYDDGTFLRTERVAALPPPVADRGPAVARSLHRLSGLLWSGHRAGVALPIAPKVLADLASKEHRGTATSFGPDDAWAALLGAATAAGATIGPLPAEVRSSVGEWVEAEADAVVQARHGQFVGRGRQGIWLAQPTVDPRRFMFAVRALAVDPSGLEDLPAHVGGPAACAAALVVAHMLCMLAGERSDLHVSDILAGLPRTAVCPPAALAALERVHVGGPPDQVVATMLTEATAAADGRVADLPALLQRLAAARQQPPVAGSEGASQRRDSVAAAAQLTPLAPDDPVRDLFAQLQALSAVLLGELEQHSPDVGRRLAQLLALEAEVGDQAPCPS